MRVVPAAFFHGRNKSILFDMDGTIICTEPLHIQAWVKVCHHLGISSDSISKERIPGISGMVTAEQLSQQLLQQTQRRKSPNEIYKIKSEAYRSFLQQAPLKDVEIPGFRTFFQSLSCQKGLITSSPRIEVNMVLKILGIDQASFGSIISKENVKIPKPAPEGYFLSMEKMQVQANICLGFEDSISGITALISAGVKNIVVIGTSLSQQQLTTFMANYEGVNYSYIKNYNELNPDYSR